MIHFSCDRCHKIIDTTTELRYVVRIEVVVASEETGGDDDCDHIQEMEALLDSLDPDECDELSKDVYRQQRFDLCADCRRAYLKHPLGQDALASVGFSKN